MVKRNDIILIVVVIIVGLSVMAFLNLNKTEGSKVLLIVNDKTVKSFSLSKNISYSYKNKDGILNTFRIKNGYVDMLDATCPDKLCVRHKKIHYNHETIVCLPHKLVLEIVGGENQDVDMIAN